MQADNHLNAVAASHHAVGAEGFEDVIALGFRHIHQRNAQAGGAVVDAFDVGRAAERLQESGGLPDLLAGRGRGGGLPARRLIVGLAVEFDFALLPARRFQVQTFDQRFEDREVDPGEADADADLVNTVEAWL